MVRLKGRKIFLSELELGDCRTLWDETEQKSDNPAEGIYDGCPFDNADSWYDDIQSDQGHRHIRLGIFLQNGETNKSVIGDIALQDINWQHSSCTIGYGIAKSENRCKGYTTDAVKVILQYGFQQLGLKRIAAATPEYNLASRRVLEKCGFIYEGRERKSLYITGKRYDRLLFGILSDEFNYSEANKYK